MTVRWIDEEDAARWAVFPVGADPRPIVLLDARLRVEGGFVDSDSKIAWLEGAIEPGTSVPPALLALLPTRRQGRAQTTLTITAVATITAPFWCDRGSRELAAYRLRLTGLRGSCVVLAPEVECWWPVDEADRHRVRVLGAAAAIDDDGVTIHFPAFGGVLTEFRRAEFQEHPAYVVGRAITSEREVPPDTPVVALGVHQEVIGQLNEPLGERVLLNTSSQPLAVTPRGASD